MPSDTFKFECQLDADSDCTVEITVEVDGASIADAYECHHITDMPWSQVCDKLWNRIEARYTERYEDAMESRVDAFRDRYL
jgi:hypothetical protein